MACLETTFLVDLVRGKKEVKLFKEELDKSESRLCMTAPSVMELWAGMFLAKSSAAEKQHVNDLIESLEVLPLDAKSAKEAGEMESELIQKGVRLETEDLMIAAIARVHGEKLVTRDQHYARIPGLKLLKY